MNTPNQSADIFSQIKAIDSNMQRTQREKLDKEVYQLDMLVDALGNKDIIQGIFHTALGTKYPIFSDHYHREGLLKILNDKPLSSKVMDLVNAAASKSEKVQILASLKKLRKALAEAEDTYSKSQHLITSPHSLPGIIVSAGMILRNPQAEGKPPQGLDFVKKLYYENRELLNAQEKYFDNGIRIPLLKILDDTENKGHQLSVNDIQSALDTMSREYNEFEKQLQHEIKNLKALCKQKIETMDFAPDLKSELETVLASEDVAAIKKVMTGLDAERRHALTQMSLLCALLDDGRVTKAHYEASAKELMTIYNQIKSQAMTTRYQKLRSTFETTVNANDRDRIIQEINAIENTFNHSRGYRKQMYSKYLEGELDKAVEQSGGKVIATFQQAALPALGSSDGLCYGFSYLFGESFNKLSSAASFEECASQLIGINQTFQMNDLLTVSMEAYLKWDSQHDLPLKDTFYHSDNAYKTSKKTVFVTDRIKRNQFSNAIIEYSKNNPCTYMLNLQSKNEGHAIGFARNQHGIWIHDSNFGLIHFNNQSEEAFKTFLSDHIATYYPGLQNSFTIANIGVAHKLKQGIDALDKLMSDLTLLTREVYEDNLGEREKVIADAGSAIKKIFDPTRKQMPTDEELIQLKSHLENMQDALQIPLECKDKIKIRELVKNCEGSIRHLQQTTDDLQKLPQVTHNPSVTSLLATHFTLASNAFIRTAKYYVNNVRSLASDYVGHFVDKLAHRHSLAVNKQQSEVNVELQIDSNSESAINYHYRIYKSPTDKIRNTLNNTGLQLLVKAFSDYLSSHAININSEIAAQLKNLLKEIKSIKSENEAEQIVAKIKLDSKISPVVRSIARKALQNYQNSDHKPRIKKS